jgi:uncharacterized protein YceH (UPF0502 family)
VVQVLLREPGRRESRWAQLYTPLPESAGGGHQPAPVLAAAAVDAVLNEGAHPDLLERVAKLEELVETLRLQVLELRQPPEA